MCNLFINNCAEFSAFPVNCFQKDKQTLRRKKISQLDVLRNMYRPIVVFHYSLFNVRYISESGK